MCFRDEKQRLDQLKMELQQLQQEGQSLNNERDTSVRLERELSEKIRRKLGEKKKISVTLNQLRNAREEEQAEQDIATYVSE